MEVVTHELPRFRYRRRHVLLKREGPRLTQERFHQEERLAARECSDRKGAVEIRAPSPIAPNDRGLLDFVSDQLTDGHCFRILRNDDRTEVAWRWRALRSLASAWSGTRS